MLKVSDHYPVLYYFMFLKYCILVGYIISLFQKIRLCKKKLTNVGNFVGKFTQALFLVTHLGNNPVMKFVGRFLLYKREDFYIGLLGSYYFTVIFF